MIRLIIEKELRDILGTVRFAATFGVSSVLIILAFVLGAQHYHLLQSRFESAEQENIQQMSSLTSDQWLMLEPVVYMKPVPLSTLVSGISYDIGRKIKMRGRGELALEDSYFSDDTAAAVFRLLDLEFVFTIVFSLLAILFCYDALSGEKERGTLRLVFSNSVPRDSYLLGKVVGSFLALGVPLLIPILIGCLIYILLGVPMAGADWIRLGMIVMGALLFLLVFLLIAVLVSALTSRTSSSFILLIVIWIVAVFIIPRSSILLAGHVVDVPAFDEIAYQKRQQMTQLVREDMDKLSEMMGIERSSSGIRVEMHAEDDDPEEAQARMQEQVQNFMKAQKELGDAREEKMDAFNEQLNTERYNRQLVQQRWAFGLARISPVTSFILSMTSMAGTSLESESHFLSAVNEYQNSFKSFQEEKAGMSSGGGFMFMIRTTDGDEAPPEPIDLSEMPQFTYRPATLRSDLQSAVFDLGVLILFALGLYAVAHVAFLRYDLR